MKTVIEMAREAGFNKNELAYLGDNFTRFAELVRADEREQCAKVCDELHWPWHMGDNSGPKECAAAIRARENT
tara:strand:+ start:3628 stop:3846 length:219 start_codon:yes stop_codon:yes gene_type:complete